DIVEGIVGEGKAAVAFYALRLTGKQLEAGNLVAGQRLRVAVDPAVETRRWRHEGPLIGRDRLGEIGGIDPRRLGKRFGERAHSRVRRSVSRGAAGNA